MKRKVYKSCNCQACRHWPPSSVKGFHKKTAHRKFRRLSKALLNKGIEDTPVVSTGYKV